MTRLRAWFNRPWGIVPFQPVCYLFLWAAAIRLAIDPSPPLPFDPLPGLGAEFYHVWLGLGMVFPAVSLWSWWWITHRPGRRRYVGMWLRLSSDIAMLTFVITYHVALAFLNAPVIYLEGRIVNRYLTAAVMLQILLWIGRDVGTLVVVERQARRG